MILLHGRHELVANGAVAVDGPALFMQGTILALAFCSVLLFAERRADPGGSAIVADAYQVPGTQLEGALRSEQTEAYPLMVFAVAGMMLFAAANNLLVMFVALEILSLAAVPAGRAGPPAAAAVAGSRRQVLPARARSPRRSSSTAWPCSTATPAPSRLPGIADAATGTGEPTSCYLGLACCRSGCSSRSARHRSTPGRRTSTRARRRR